MILLLIPNIIYAFQNKSSENKCKSKVMNFVEQIGRYGSMFLMIFSIGIFEYVWKSDEAFAMWLIVNVLLILTYWTLWGFYSRSQQMILAILLAVVPSMLFILSGYFIRHWLLMGFGFVFLIGHTYVTYQNNRDV